MNQQDKQAIWDNTSGGLSIFEYLIPGLRVKGKKSDLFPSLFREEKSPSANIFQKGGVWFYKDFGDTDAAMNALDVLMKIHHIEFGEALKMAANLANMPEFKIERQPLPPEVVLRPDLKKLYVVLSNTDTELHQYLREALHIPNDHLNRWNLGMMQVKDVSYTCFAFKNHLGELVNLKWMKYGENGKRIKDIRPSSLVGKNPGEVYKWCLFGSHLLRKDVPACLVESEKTAVIASFFYPQFDWLATRGQNGAGLEEYRESGILDGRAIAVLVDADPERKIPKAFQILAEQKANVHLLDLMPERSDKTDIADFIGEGLRPEVFIPDLHRLNEDTGEIEFFPSMPDWAKAKMKPEELEENLKTETQEPATESVNDLKKRIKSLESLRNDYAIGSDVYNDIHSQIIELKSRLKESTGGKKAPREEPVVSTMEYLSIIPDDAYTDDYDPDHDLNVYGFYQYKNSYWKLSKEGKSWASESFTNFTMKVLFHIDNGRSARRLIEIKNNRGVRKTLDVETKALTNLGSFKEFVEGAGNFLFHGSASDHQRIKAKLFEEELPCVEVEVLGQHPDGFFCFSNGIYQEQEFLSVDENGIITLPDRAYYIASGNKTYRNNKQMFQNEKRVTHTERDCDFRTWSDLHLKVFGDPSMVATLFGISCLFSDIIYGEFNFFPLLFVYGEGGSGKGELIISIQWLFGTPQDPLTLSTDANTDKGKVRALAQFRNLLIRLEEFRNGNEKTNNLLKNIWDRNGYQRAKMDNSYRTDTVPINSGVMVTGNEYPTDDPVVQRLLVLEINKNSRTQEQSDNFFLMKDYQEAGITSITCQILNHRKRVEQNYREQFKVSQKDLRTLMQDVKVTDRMIGNMAVLDAIFHILHPVLSFPFTIDQLRTYMKAAMKRQNEKRDTGSEVQRFWDCIMYLANECKIHEGREIELDGDKLYLRFTEIHAAYMIAHRAMHMAPGLSKQTMLDKLKESDAYIEYKNSQRLGETRTSCHVFSYKKIEATGVNLIRVFELNRRRNHGQHAPSQEPEPQPQAKPLDLPTLQFNPSTNDEETLPF